MLTATGLLAIVPVGRGEGAYPVRPITLIVPFAPGGIADLTARVVAEAMARDLGQPIVIDNRPSAGNIVGSAAVAQARPDGYTLLLLSNGNAVSASLFKHLPYEVARAFAPVTTLGFFDLVVLADGGARYRTLADLVADARKRPGRITIATITPGSTQNLAAELFKRTAGIETLIVPYKASPAVLSAVRSGEVDVAFEILGPILPQIKAGVVRALAITSPTRYPGLPDVPPVRDTAGLAGYDVSSWNALAAPAATPEPVIDRLAQAARAAIGSAAVQGKLEALGVRPAAGTPAELRTLLASEITRWRAVIAAAGIEPQ
jgi:tripartite-type tricarboxylate transporter receptor subunit TctC